MFKARSKDINIANTILFNLNLRENLLMIDLYNNTNYIPALYKAS